MNTNSIGAKEIKALAEALYRALLPDCKAIYLGGSRVDDIIENPHDWDLIVLYNEAFGPAAVTCEWRLRKKIAEFSESRADVRIVHDIADADKIETGAIDTIQLRNEHDSGRKLECWQYLDAKMILLAGESSDFARDIFGKDRGGYLRALKEKADALRSGRVNQKRWYQVYIGTAMLRNGSYELTAAQKEAANTLHDMRADTAEARKRLQKEAMDVLEKLI